MAMREQPCPYRIIDDFGGAFSMGCFAGCIFYFLKGMSFAPKEGEIFRRAPILGGSFALWGGLFSITDCTLMHLRNQQDFINPIVAGAFTGGFLAIRAGTRIAVRNAIFGGIILGFIQLAEIGMLKIQMREEMKRMQQQQQQQMQEMQEMMAMQVQQPSKKQQPKVEKY
ncbi:unnamed protein product (macronuclear) [Paramecium tetraurelia]|uniref:Uncharacterized protein n=1 Tax=Paramecium tetraurelia TaxID=5888 RepID=A0EB74_PARTE|nr:uncharacterized protein GSPATT00025275001 [Paramecium tetraurelia]CAK92541.1 unnamed protein product [Paramecium tetraurelia]|eukprot:XP_001459938.1 hypothetical protein (macronuclear) [Paramecium tetraurelia strain d4-2]